MKIRGVFLATSMAVILASCNNSGVDQKEFDKLKNQVERFQSKEQIIGISNVYSDAAAQQDKELFRDLWTEDSEWIIGSPINKTFKGRDNIADAFENLLGGWEFFVQLNTSYNVDLSEDGKSATSNFYMNEIARNEKLSNYNLAQYKDKLVKEDGQWRFKVREYKVIYLDTTALRGQAFQRTKRQ